MLLLSSQSENVLLDALTDKNPPLQEFGMGGLANICLEPRHHQYIMSQPLYRQNIINCLHKSSTINTRLNAMTTLMQLVTAENYTIILTTELEGCLQQIKSDTQHTQASTMAALFLVDYYHYTI